MNPDLCAVSLVDLLARRASESSRRPAYTFLANGEEESGGLTFSELDRRARGIAASLQELGVEGERALLLYPPGLAFVEAFLGCLYAGVVAVPAYPPRGGKPEPRLRAMAQSAEPRLVLTAGSLLPRATLLAQEAPELARLTWRATDGESADPEAWARPELGPDTLAFLQYTSGSTASPKGVMVRHGHLLHNEEMIRRAFAQSPESVVVSWLPLYHDMGLIGGVLQPLYSGGRCVLFSPVAFLQRPVRWLAAIDRYRATTSGAPDFAYALCCERISQEERETLDLSSWQVAFNGAEPVRAATLERFARLFEPQGFRRQAFYPCYGLAEATLLVTGGAVEEAPRVQRLEVPALERGEVRQVPEEEAQETPEQRDWVGCGRPWSEQRLRIVDPETRQPCPPDRVGEIWVAGPSVAGGYWDRQEETEETFEAELAGGEGPFLRTGDLGFVSTEGELFVTGRIKDLIILRGRNLYPQDLEATAGVAHPDLRPAGGTAFSIDAEGEERLVVVCELDRRSKAEPRVVAEAVRSAVAQEHGARPWEVVLLRAGTLPRTSSGKVQRHVCRQRYLASELTVVGTSGIGEVAAVADGAAAPLGDRLREAAPGERRALVEESLGHHLARIARLPPSELRWDEPPLALGLDSLMAVELQNAVEVSFGVSLTLADLFSLDDLRHLVETILERLDTAVPAGEGPAPVAAGVATGEEQPLSDGQRGLWFLSRLDPEGAAYHIAAAARVHSELDEGALARALRALVARHGALRTSFGESGGEPFQWLGGAGAVELAVMEIEDGGEEGLEERLRREAFSPFDLERGPLVRLRLYRRPGAKPALLLALHHLVSDFWSLTVMARELAALYRQEAGGPAAELPPPALSYADYVAWHKTMLAGPRGERLLGWWRESLAGAPPELDLPLDRPRPPVQSFDGSRRTLGLSEEVSAALEALGRSRGATLFVTVLALFELLLHRHTGQEEVVVGTPTAGRGHPGLETLVGYLVSPVALRGDLSGDPPFTELLERTRQRALAVFEHQDAPAPLLAERLRLDRDASRPPMFQVMLVLLPAVAGSGELAAFGLGERGVRVRLGDLDLEPLPLESPGTPFDLMLTLGQVRGRLAASLQYSTALFDGVTAERLVRRFAVLAESATVNPERRLSELSMLAPAERHQLLTEWNDTASGAPPGRLDEGFREQARRRPEATALVWGEGRWSYRQLAAASARLARRLRRHGVGPEVRVGVLLERQPDLVVALLAVLEAGGVYVPLDPAYPAERVCFVLEDARCSVLLSGETSPPALTDSPVPRLAVSGVLEESALEDGEPEGVEPPPSGVEPGNLAYLIYTSGSTGRPKGVAITHGSAAALVDWSRTLYGAEDLRGVAAATSVCFDLSVYELFVPLSRGGTVVLLDDALALREIPPSTEVTLVNTVPSAMAELVRSGGVPETVRTVNLAGEPLPRELVEAIYQRTCAGRVLNLYGPSEDTTYSTWALVPAGQPRAPSIGRPVGDTRAYLLDRHLTPVPPGAVGELFLSGAGLARGYFGRPGRTAGVFLPDPLSGESGARMYRTGDRVRRRHDGEMEFLGRADHQVKLRGFRIELGEVETALLGHEAVAEAVVVVREDRPGDRRLVGYVAPPPGVRPAAGELVAHLGERLPAFMVPGALVVLPELPRLPNGKVDRKALPAPETEGERTVAPPRTPVEELLAGIWREVLGVGSVGVEDSFFSLGGHSLLATRALSRVRETFGVELSLRSFFEAPTLASLAHRVEAVRGSTAAAPPPLDRRPAEGPQPLSFPQERLWLLHRLDPDSDPYHLAGAVHLGGVPAVAALEGALEQGVARHETLRTVFPSAGGEPAQEVLPAERLHLPAIDLRRLPRAERDREAQRRMRRRGRRPFDLEHGPLLRLALLRLAAGEHRLFVASHHINADGWSLGVWARDLAALYGALCEGRPSPLAQPPVRYRDFAVGQRAWLAEGGLDDQLSYWKQRLSGELPLLSLPLDRPRPRVRRQRGARLPMAVGADLLARLGELGRRRGATLFTTLLALWQTLTHRSTGQWDLVAGTPVANRRRVELEGLVGCFVNTLVLRTDVSGDPGFGELLGRLREEVLGAWDHQDLPFEKLVEELDPGRDMSRTPLFQVLFVLQTAPPPPEELPGLGFELEELDLGRAKFDLNLTLEQRDGGLRGYLEYDRDLFDATTVRRLLGQFQALAAAAAEAPERRLSALPMLSAAQRQQLVYEYNDTVRSWPRDHCLHELFVEQAARSPEAEAVVFGQASLSYRELHLRAGRLARCLRRLGVGPEEVVALLVEPCPEMVVAVLGVLESGGAYLPLDPATPRARLAFLLEDAGARLLLTQEKLSHLAAGCAVRPLMLDAGGGDLAAEDEEDSGALSASTVGPANLAYVIYTSGSTGRPKGTLLSHRGVVNYLTWTRRAYPLDQGRGAPLHSSIAFDLSITALFAPLLAGRRVVLTPAESGVEALSAVLRQHEDFSLVKLTPGHLRLLGRQLTSGELAGRSRSLVVGGEALLAEDLEPWQRAAPEVRVFNEYGPTETVVGCCVHEVGSSPWAGEAVPIGRPIANTRIHVLDGDLRPVLRGAVGELCIGGAGLARGYLGRPGLTGERFVPDPFPPQPGERLYRSGDLARLLADGSLEFLGRIDQQVKLRGYRVELGEIEAVLSSHEAVAESVVVVQGEGMLQRLVAFLVVAAKRVVPAAGELRRHLREQLCDYMMPALFVPLDALPLTPSGKVDRKSLAALGAVTEPVPAPAGPSGPVEEILCGIWSELLGREGVGVAENFFELGGHSLLATRVLSRVRGVFGADLPLRTLFENPTVASFAAVLGSAGGRRASPPIERLPREGEVPLSFSQQRLWLLEQLEPETGTYNIAASVALEGDLAVAALDAGLSEVVRRHEALRTIFPSFGGRPFQRLTPAAVRSLPVIDLGALPARRRERELKRLEAAEALAPFDLAAGPLLRASVVRRSDRGHVLLITFHHIVGDGWSIAVLVRELTTAYAALREGRPCPLGELALQYQDFAAWQRRWLTGEVLEQQLDHWRRRLADAPSSLELPVDRPRPRVQSFRGGRRSRALEPALTAALEGLSRREGVTLFMTLLSALATLLGRLAGQRQVMIGSPVAGRNRQEVEDLIGVFINNLVLRVDLGGEPTFRRLLGRVRETTLEAYAHQDVPFEKLLEELNPVRDLSRTPWFQVLLNMLNFPREEIRLPGLTAELRAAPELPSKFDLTLYVEERAGGLRLDLVYNSELFDGERMEALLDQLESLLRQATADPDRLIYELSLRTGAADRALPDPSVRLPFEPREPVHRAFEQRAREAGERPAVIDGDVSWSYRELEEWSRRLAADLGRRGIGPHDLVAFYGPRSAELVAAVLGILRAGATFLLLDPAHPAPRLVERLRVASRGGRLRGWWGARATVPAPVAEQLAAEDLAVCGDLPALEELPEAAAIEPIPEDPETPAYLAFTSGTTGAAKGIVGLHAPLTHFVGWQTRRFDLGPEDRFAMLSGIGHDPLLRDLFTPLSLGAAISIPEPEVITDPARLRGWLRASRVTVAHLTPALGRLLTSGAGDEPRLDHLRFLFFGGDILTWHRVRRLAEIAPAARLASFYGATETPQAMGCFDVGRLEAGGEGCSGREGVSVPLGCGIDGAQLLVLGPAGQPAGIGELGEIHVRTPYLAAGYLADPEQTAERFLADPWAAGSQSRLYRTGDLGRHLPEGDVVFAGRADRQVKVRGFRVEPGEIEAALEKHPGVSQAAVVALEDSVEERRLVAYFVPQTAAAPGAEELRELLRRSLPEPLLPAGFVPLEALPLTPSGKLDTAALPSPEARPALDQPYVAPRTPLEEKVAGVWAELLKISRVGVEDNFFALGGNSLLGARLVARLQEALGVELPLRRLFEAPTVAGMAEAISRLERQEGAPPPAPAALPRIVPRPEERSEPFPLTDLQQAYWVGRGGDFQLGNVASHRYLEIESQELDLDRLRRVWNRLIERHDMLRAVVRPDGSQRVLAEVPPYPIEVSDLRGLPPGRTEAELETVRRRMSHEVRPAERWPLFEIRASLLDGSRTRIHVGFDYLIADAWSFLILGRELAELLGDPEAPLPPLELTFRDCVLVGEEIQGSELYRRSWRHWQQRVADLPPAPALPLMRSPDSLATPRFVRRSASLPPELWSRLLARAVEAGLTPSGMLLAAYSRVLAEWSASPRFTLVLTLFNRLDLHDQIESVVGDFTSTTLVAVEGAQGGDFATFAGALQRQLWESLDHRHVSGVAVLRELARTGGAARAAMPVVFTSLLEQSRRDSSGEAIRRLGEIVYSISQTPQVYLDHQVSEQEGALVFNWDAVEEIFPPGLLDEMFGAYVGLLESLAGHEETWRLTPPGLLPRRQIEALKAYNATAAPVPSGLLHAPFLEQARREPGRPAILSSRRTLTYGELLAAAASLAHRLRRQGLGRGELAAVVCSKGWEQVTAALAVLLAGGAYLPVDPELPQERIDHLLAVTRARFALTQPAHARALEWPAEVEVTEVTEETCGATGEPPPPPAQSPGDLAYVIFTSGSTGLPKGVMIDHRGALNTVVDVNERFAVGPEDRVLALSSLSFDLSVYDLFGILAAGGAIVLPEPEASRDPGRWVELIEEHRVTLWNSVPALMEMLVEHAGAERLDPIRLVLMSGDWIPVSLPDRIRTSMPAAQVVSLGGATEASIWSILHPIDQVDPSWPSIPYGRPMKNQTIHVLGPDLEPRPEWVPGEIHIGGVGVALGYWRDEEKTAASFFTHPRTGERLYRTGDLGRHLPSGEVEFLGREDFQVKIQGYRIELGEIETALAQHPGLRTAVVLAVGERLGAKRLVACMVSEGDRQPSEEELRTFLGERLPAYMVPVSYRFLDALPLSANGKVDRGALAALETARTASAARTEGPTEEPRTGIEQTLARIWREVLGVERVGLHDSFYELGGDSILAIRIAARAGQEGLHLNLQQLYQSPTIAELAAVVEADSEVGDEAVLARVAAVMGEIGDLPPEQIETMLAALEMEEDRS